MNAFEKMEYSARIRAIGSTLRAQRLDEDGVEDDPERDAKADALLATHPESELKDALQFALYLKAMVDPACSTCKGLGAVVLRDRANKGITYEPCDCARQNEKKMKAAAPAFSSKGSREADLDQRIAQVKAQLAAAIARRNEATAPVVKEIQELDLAVQNYTVERRIYEDRVATSTKTALATRKEIDDLRTKLQEASARLDKAQIEEANHAKALVAFDDSNAGLAGSVIKLKAKHDRVAGHHAPKIEKAERTLRRLTYLRGDAREVVSANVTASDVDVTFKEGTP